MHTFFSPHHLEHATGRLFYKGLPFRADEVPQRADNIAYALGKADLGPLTPAQDHGMQPLLRVHHPDMLQHLQNTYAENHSLTATDEPVIATVFAVPAARHRPRLFSNQSGLYCFDSDTPIVAGTWQAAYWSAQAALSAADHLRRTGEITYALCRPPGHHAGPNFYGGYCFLNNAAIAARSLGERLAILDLDYHHGNGTQEVFYADPQVFTCSLHASPDWEYPYYWGGAGETGEAQGLGFNLNFPLNRGIQDPEYLLVLDQALEAVSAFQPRVLVLSIGFDILAGDPQGGFCLTYAGLAQIGHRIAGLQLPTLVIQEGGYAIRQIGEHAVTFLRALSG